MLTPTNTCLLPHAIGGFALVPNALGTPSRPLLKAPILTSASAPPAPLDSKAEVPPLAETDPAVDDTTHVFLANLANATIEANEQMTALGVTVAALKLQVETANTALAASQAA
jgi:hypothetical protein